MYFSNYTTLPDALTMNNEPTHFYQLVITSILWVQFSKIKKTLFLKENQLFCTTATKEILPSTTLNESAVDTFALYVLLTNFCSWKIVLKKPHSTKSPAQRNLHALYHVNVTTGCVHTNQPLKDALYCQFF